MIMAYAFRKAANTVPLLVALGLVLLASSGCTTAPAPNRFPQLTYQHLAPLAFDVRQVEVVGAYQPKGAPPNVEHLIETVPQDAALQWARDRLQAVGLHRRLRFTVVDAAIVETPLELKGGLEGLITTEQSERYEGHLVVMVEIFSDSGAAEGAASAEVRRSITVPESASLGERERVWFTLTEKLVLDLSGQLEKTLAQVFPQYLRS